MDTQKANGMKTKLAVQNDTANFSYSKITDGIMLPRIVSERLIEKGTRKCKRDNRCPDHRVERQVTFFFLLLGLQQEKSNAEGSGETGIFTIPL